MENRSHELSRLILAGKDALAKDKSGEAPFFCGLEREATEKMISNAEAALIAMGQSPDVAVIEYKQSLARALEILPPVDHYGAFLKQTIETQASCMMAKSGLLGGMSMCISSDARGPVTVCFSTPMAEPEMIERMLCMAKKD